MKNFVKFACRAAVVGLATSLSLSACSQHPSWNESEAPDTRAATVEIKTFFDAKGCPSSVNKAAPEFKASSGDKIEWRAYRGVGDAAEFDPAIEFAIYFDPFVDGKPIVSHKGIARSAKINARTPQQYPGGPDVFYKYTIISEGCEPVPLDPRMRVLH
tara:strand:+ start:61395 stop:61868 length:474 start_codon:yes stop_codon:yes gene_type:complete